MSTNALLLGVRAAIVVLLAMLATTPQVAAQMSPVSALSAVGVRASEDALGNMLGAGFTTLSPLGRTSKSLQLSGFAVAAGRDGFGRPCAGLIFPGACPPEALRTTSGLGVMSLGLAARVFDRNAVQVHFAAGPSGGLASTYTRGTVSRRTLRGTKGVWGAFAGLDGFWWPEPHSSLGVHVGLSVMGLRAGGIACVDCYVPFGEGFVVSRFQLGVTFGRRVVPGASAP